LKGGGKMNKILLVVAIIAIAAIGTTSLVIAKKDNGANAECTTIQDGTLFGSDGSQLATGYNEWGYNYQAHLFNGKYCDYHPVYRPGGANHEWCVENYGDVSLVMKWNDAWLSNKDCDGNGLLDRYYGFPSYIGSGSWTTNHMKGSYVQDGKTCKWEYFVKIVAAPADATASGGIWYTANGVEIGPVIWGSFATIQEVENDPCAGLHGKSYVSPAAPGFGKYK